MKYLLYCLSNFSDRPPLSLSSRNVRKDTYLLSAAHLAHKTAESQPRLTRWWGGFKTTKLRFFCSQNLSLFLRVLWWPENMVGVLRPWLSFVLCFQHGSHSRNLCAPSPPLTSTRIELEHDLVCGLITWIIIYIIFWKCFCETRWWPYCLDDPAQ